MTSSQTEPDQETTEESSPPEKANSPGWVHLIAVAAVLAAAFLWLWDQMGSIDPGAADRAALSQSQSALSERIDELAKIPTFADPARVDQLQASVDNLTEQVAPVPTINDRVGVLETASGEHAERLSENAKGVAAIGERVAVRVNTVDSGIAGNAEKVALLDARTAKTAADLTARLDTQAAGLASVTAGAKAMATDLTALTAKQAASDEAAAALADKVDGLEQRLAKIEAWIETAQPARVAEQLVALAELRRVVDSGAAFTGALKRVQASVPAAGDLPDTATWVGFSTTGLPTVAKLAGDLDLIAAKRPRSSPVDSGSTWVDSAVGSLLKNVRVGDGPPLGADAVAAGLYNARRAMATGDLDAADAALAPVAEQDPAVVKWLEALTARRDALAAIAAWDKTVLAAISEASQ